VNPWLILTIVYLALFISNPLIVLLHELGHAFAYLLLTKPDKVDIYIGSYGDAKSHVNSKIGKLIFHVRRSFPFIKGVGLCCSSKAETNYIKRIVILLSGAVFTLFSATVLSIFAFNADVHLLIKVACYIFLGLSVISLITNLVPRDINPFSTNTLESDGRQLIFTLKIKRSLPDYVEAMQFVKKEEFEPGIAKLKTVLAAIQSDEKILRLLIFTTLKAKQYDDTALYIAQLEGETALSATDLFYKGCLQSLTHQHDAAIETYSKVLKKDRNNLLALYNIGYELVEKGAHEVALRALEKAMKINPQFDEPYACLGYSKIIQNDLEVGLTYINRCLQLNTNNAHAYKGLGIYYLKLKDVTNAKLNFNKAIALDKDTDIKLYADEIDQLTKQNTLRDNALANY